MYLLLMGDLHLTDRRPVNRTDDYYQALYEKLHWIVDTFNTEVGAFIIQPGDLFDSHKANDYLKQDFINFMWDEFSGDSTLLTVFGQHDLRYHSSRTDNTPLRVCEAARAVRILQAEPWSWNNVSFYGASWFDDIPEIEDPEQFNVLVTHRMVIDKPLWEGQTEATYANILLRTTKFDLIVSGDNHTTFTAKHGDRYLINPGSVMRSSIAQFEHEPCVFLFDTATKIYKQLFIPVARAAEVLSDKPAKEKERRHEIDAFIHDLQTDFEIPGLNFAHNLWSYIKENDIDQETKDILKEVLPE